MKISRCIIIAALLGTMTQTDVVEAIQLSTEQHHKHKVHHKKVHHAHKGH